MKKERASSVDVSVSLSELEQNRYEFLIKGIQLALNDLSANVMITNIKVNKGRLEFKVGDRIPVPKSELIVREFILSFCENAAELGCPRDCKEVDMWFRELSVKKQQLVMKKLLKIMDRNKNEIR